ncbi:unnamed protein product [Protopolystoma xenopodis]|uniref:Uncharacterized protein n=1 Tax=Protopolystoma xenopodis TaxID=117903 RepID=A0A3S4ZPC6_9PLAT|nr:unnamed protein product [Protopolystoma xenopodis]
MRPSEAARQAWKMSIRYQLTRLSTGPPESQSATEHQMNETSSQAEQETLLFDECLPCNPTCEAVGCTGPGPEACRVCRYARIVPDPNQPDRFSCVSECPVEAPFPVIVVETSSASSSSSSSSSYEPISKLDPTGAHSGIYLLCAHLPADLLAAQSSAWNRTTREPVRLYDLPSWAGPGKGRTGHQAPNDSWGAVLRPESSRVVSMTMSASATQKLTILEIHEDRHEAALKNL